MKIRWFVIPCVLAMFVTLAPETARATPGWTWTGVITEINQQPGGGYNGYVFITATVTSNPSACSNPTFFYFAAINDDRQKRMLTMLLTAQATGRQVRIWATDTCHPWGASLLDGVIIVS
jgi:hypothetical protein